MLIALCVSGNIRCRKGMYPRPDRLRLRAVKVIPNITL